MYTCSDIHQKLDAILTTQGFVWLKDELLYSELPVAYWSSDALYFRAQITERQNAVYFEVARFTKILPESTDSVWINIYEFSNEYKRRIGMPLSELVKLVPTEIVGCLEQLENAVPVLPILLKAATEQLHE
jgi:hypothetical protein